MPSALTGEGGAAGDGAGGNGQAGNVKPAASGAQAGSDGAGGEPAKTGDSPAAAGGSEPKGQEPAAPTAPESYEFQTPQGYQLDQGLLDLAVPVFRELKLPQDQAQKLVDLHVKQIQQREAGWTRMTETWLEETRKDPEIGGEAYSRNIDRASAFLKRFASPKLIDWLDSTGIGNHPELVRVFVKLSQAVGEDTTAGSGGTQMSQADAEKARLRQLYPTMDIP